jgi:hypothetical protein
LFSKVVVLACIPTSSVRGFLFPLHTHQHLLVVVVLKVAIILGVRWNLSMVFICISFKARDDEHFFMCFLAIWISSLEKVAHFFIGSLTFGEFRIFKLSVYSFCQSFV